MDLNLQKRVIIDQRGEVKGILSSSIKRGDATGRFQHRKLSGVLQILVQKNIGRFAPIEPSLGNQVVPMSVEFNPTVER